MRLALLALAPVVMLAGCNSAGTVQADAVKICGFLPTAAAIANVLNASPKLTQPIAIAQAICDAVLAKPTTFGAARIQSLAKPSGDITVIVRGVRVTGHFVK